LKINDKRKRAKRRTIVANGGILTVREGQDKVYEREINEQIQNEARGESSRMIDSQSTTRAQSKCSLCESLEHNARTCAKRKILASIFYLIYIR
jgi:hypothetical protein